MLQEKKEKVMSVRMSVDDYKWLEKASFAMGSTPSKFVRQLVQMAINASKQAEMDKEKMNRIAVQQKVM